MAEEQPVTLNHVTIPGYKNKFNNREEKRGSGVGLKYKRRGDITTKDSTIEHMWLQVKSEKDSFLLAVFYQPRSSCVE